MLKAKQKLLIWPEVRTRGETVMQDYGVETLNRDGQPLEYHCVIYFYLFKYRRQRAVCRYNQYNEQICMINNNTK